MVASLTPPIIHKHGVRKLFMAYRDLKRAFQCEFLSLRDQMPKPPPPFIFYVYASGQINTMHSDLFCLQRCELTLMCLLHCFTMDLDLNAKKKPLDAHKIS